MYKEGQTENNKSNVTPRALSSDLCYSPPNKWHHTGDPGQHLRDGLLERRDWGQTADPRYILVHGVGEAMDTSAYNRQSPRHLHIQWGKSKEGPSKLTEFFTADGTPPRQDGSAAHISPASQSGCY